MFQICNHLTQFQSEIILFVNTFAKKPSIYNVGSLKTKETNH